MINYRLKIEFCDSKTLASDICFVSGDVKSSTLNFEFYNDGKRVDISGYTLSVRARRSDGVVVASLGKIENNTAVFTPENNFYAVPGELYMEIALSDSSGKYVTTKVILAEVVEGLGKDVIEGENNVNVYVKLLADAVSAKESAEAAAQVAKSVHPKIIDGIWWVYDAAKGVLVPTEIKAEGTQGIQGQKGDKGDKGDKGEKGEKGEKGDIGAQGYSPVKGVDYYTEEEKKEIANEVLQESNTGYANALKGNVKGSFISVNDVSPCEHAVKAKVSSKNLIPFPYPRLKSSFTINGVTATAQSDGGILINGTPTGEVVIHLWQTDLGKQDINSKSTHGMISNSNGDGISTHYNANDRTVFVYVTEGRTYDNVLFYPQIEYGYESTGYTLYVDVNAVTLTACGKNLFNQYVEPTNPLNPYYHGVEITDLVKVINGKYKCVSIALKEGKTIPETGKLAVMRINSAGNVEALPLVNNGSIVKDEQQLQAWEGSQIMIASGSTNAYYDMIDAFDIQICGKDIYSEKIPVEPYVGSEYTPNADGSVDGVKSVYPVMNVFTNTKGVTINCEYNKDINKVIDNLTNTIISLGGNV